MLKSQRKVKITGEKRRGTCTCCTSSIAGKASCVGLLLLAFLLVNPLGSLSASALEDFAEDGVVAAETGELVAQSDDGVVPQVDSGVTISFTPSSGSASLTPTTSDGASAKINVSANVKIASTGGYTIYLGGKNAALTGEKTGQTIVAMSGSKTFANLDTNTWGYAVAEGSSVPDTATYSALPQGQGKSLTSVSGNQTNVNKTYAISFATKIGNDKPADTYSNQVTLSVTSSPLQISLNDIANLQDMTPDHCAGTAEGFSKQLKDTRDGKYYWASKLADGKCWMTQNLDLDLSTSTALTPADSDVTKDWKPSFNSASQATSGSIAADSVGRRSWDLGDYRITNPTNTDDCGSQKNDVSQCSAQFTAYSTPTSANKDANAHYIVGNYYRWKAAIAETTIDSSGQASGSICPKGWRLPTSNGSDEFQALLDAYSVGDDVSKLASAPLYFVRGGRVSPNTGGLFGRAGDYGYYWSSSMPAGSSDAYSLYFHSSDRISADAENDWSYGFSIRCLAR